MKPPRTATPRGLGKKHRPEYNSWMAMRHRCYQEGGKRHASYMGKGITVCDRWYNSFEAFLEDMGKKPTPKHTIHRIDNDGNYEPSNCKWADASEQAKCKSTFKTLTYNGETLTVRQWAERLNLSLDIIWARSNKGLPIEEVLDPHVQTMRDAGLKGGKSRWKGYDVVTITDPNGITHTIPEWSKIIGVREGDIRRNLEDGLPIDKVLAPRIKMTMAEAGKKGSDIYWGKRRKEEAARRAKEEEE